MGRRIDLHEQLVELLGSPNVYFQPPSSVMMNYPAIVYARDYAKTLFGDNRPYHGRTRYQITVIDKNPDSVILDRIAALPMCLFSRHYTADNLNHDTYNLYF
jgi:hypothetical protein